MAASYSRSYSAAFRHRWPYTLGAQRRHATCRGAVNPAHREVAPLRFRREGTTGMVDRFVQVVLFHLSVILTLIEVLIEAEMLSFQIIQSGTAIQVHLDEEGLAMLLSRIKDARRFGHVHLRTASNGGKELDEETPFGEKAVGEVIVDWEGENQQIDH